MLLEGQLGRGPFARFEAPVEQGSKASQKAGIKHPSPRFNSMAVKDGRVRAAARLEGIRSPSERSKTNAKSSRQLGPHALE